jgi:hypothetical protein
MVALNISTEASNAQDDLSPSDVIKRFLSDLTDEQWKLLTGSVGIGISDLTSDDQRGEYLALFPPNRVIVHKVGPDPGSVPVTQDDILHSHLRFGQTVSVAVPVAGSNRQNWLGAPSRYGNISYTANLLPAFVPDQGRPNAIRQEVPNALKNGDLGLDASALALCVTGAYRKVGPAYVLTDDVAGAGARRESRRRPTGSFLRIPSICCRRSTRSRP